MGSSSDDEARPDPATQNKLWTQTEVSDLKLGDTWFVVDQKWYVSFLSYIKGGADGYIPREPPDLDNKALVVDPSAQAKYDNVSVLEEAEAEFAEALQKHKKREWVLRRGLQEGRDFALISEAQHKLLRSWYKGGPYIARKVVQALSGKVVELWPLQLWAQLDSRDQERRPMLVSRTMAVEKLWELGCKEAEAGEGMEARLRSHVDPSHVQRVDKSETQSLEEFGVENLSVLVFSERRDRRSNVFQSAGSGSRIEGPISLPCPPPVSATGMDIIASLDEDTSEEEAANRRNAPQAQGEIEHGKGLCGLGNMGNTCFMNSSLQCLSNSEPLTRYFLSGQWKHDLNTDNALGYSGTLAQEYSSLLSEIWSKQESLYPRSFKSMIARYAPQFTGYSQHDSQELLAFLLDGLHEDTNKIRKKPPTETPKGDGTNDAEIAALSWERYKLRNDSVVLDLFSGQYRSELVCPKCGNVSVTFDPFNNITVQLPQSNSVTVSVTFHALDPLTPPAKVDLEFSRTHTVSHVKAELARRFMSSASNIVLACVWYSEFRQFYEDTDKIWEYGRLKLDDDIHAFELDTEVPPDFSNDASSRFRSNYSTSNYSSNYSSSSSLYNGGGGIYGGGGMGWSAGESDPVSGPEDGTVVAAQEPLVVLKVLVRKADRKSSTVFRDLYECFDTPFVISAPAGGPHMCRTLRERICRKMSRVFREPWRSKFGGGAKPAGRGGVNSNQADAMEVDENGGGGLKMGEGGMGELLEKAFVLRKIEYARHEGTELEGYSEGGPSLEDRQLIAVDWTQEGLDKVLDPDAEDLSNLQSDNSTQSAEGGTTVQQCLKLFTTPEVLSEQDTWLCGKCKSDVRATKTMGLWSLPKLLVIHLKRFNDQGGFYRDKVDTFVRFPLEGLDMAPYAKGPQANGTVYDLYAVSNHFGGTGFGHYTAFCKSPADGKWYNFDDTSVRPCSVDSVVSPAAYVLFYRRRDVGENGAA